MISGVKSITQKYVDALIDFSPTEEIKSPTEEIKSPTEEIKQTGIGDLQRDGSVALFNMLVRNGVAYLADEVGMGKTYIALAVMSLLRYQKPAARVLIITPRRNIQEKWAADLQSFVQQNWKQADHRVKTPQGSPDWPMLLPDRLSDWVRQVHTEDAHDTVLRTTSFSLGIDQDNVEQEISRFRANLDGIPAEDVQKLNTVNANPTQEAFIDVVRDLIVKKAHYDLVIVDEAHNLKHGYRVGEGASIRNESLYHFFAKENDHKTKPWLLMLSATPMENGDPSSLVRQFEVFGRDNDQLHSADGCSDIVTIRNLMDGASLARQREQQRRLIVRRVGELRLKDGTRYTRNMYRKEWRAGGVESPEQPMAAAAPSSRLINAVLQKNVFELLQARSGGRFRIGALESFEIYAGAESVLTEIDPNNSQQQQSLPDQQIIADLCESYRKEFSSEVPHPKLDAVTKMLGEKIARREKALVFVRRVATTKDLATRASEYFDQQIIEAIKCVSDPKEHQLLDEIYRVWRKKRVSRNYIEDMNDVKAADAQDNVMTSEHDTSDEEEDDSVSEVVPSLFTWFFRGEHSALSKDFPDIDIFSGRRMREQLEARSRFSLILEENYVDWVLKRPKNVVARLAQDSGLNEEQVLEQISSKFADELSGSDNFRRMFHGAQYAALSWMVDQPCYSDLKEKLTILLDEIFRPLPTPVTTPATSHATDRIREALSLQGIYPALTRCTKETLPWKVVARGVFEEVSEKADFDFRKALRRREQIRHMQMALFRHGAPVIDLYLACISSRQGRIRVDSRELGLDVNDVAALLTERWLQLAEKPDTGRASGAWELDQITQHFDVIKKLNFPTLDMALQHIRPLDLPFLTGQEPRVDRAQEVRSVRRFMNQEIAGQAPTAAAKGGQSDERRHRITTHFRMPGMPWVIVATNVYEEGVDLHTFCRTVVHHGISHTASSIEQRTGRVDRIGGLLQREAGKLPSAAEFTDEKKIQSLFPYQNDTFEKFQVRRVLSNCNRFIQSLHDSDTPTPEAKEMNIADKETIPPQIEKLLTSPFDVQDNSPWLTGVQEQPDRHSDFSNEMYLQEIELLESKLSSLPGYKDSGGQGLERHYVINAGELRLTPKSHREKDHLVMEIQLNERIKEIDCDASGQGWSNKVFETLLGLLSARRSCSTHIVRAEGGDMPVRDHERQGCRDRDSMLSRKPL